MITTEAYIVKWPTLKSRNDKNAARRRCSTSAAGGAWPAASYVTRTPTWRPAALLLAAVTSQRSSCTPASLCCQYRHRNNVDTVDILRVRLHEVDVHIDGLTLRIQGDEDHDDDEKAFPVLNSSVWSFLRTCCQNTNSLQQFKCEITLPSRSLWWKHTTTHQHIV